MSPNGISPTFDKILLLSSSESSDSESLLQEDIKSSGNRINKQWEAIERTLYQEPGEQVTDPEIVKECKLWRESFPHFRVKGTKIDVKLPESEVSETETNMQTLKKHFNLKKLEEKRESIKNKVVGMLVDRLIAKYGVRNVNSGLKKNSLNITEVDENDKPSKVSHENYLMKSSKNCESSNPTEKESYFERGKTATKGSDLDEGYISKEQAEKSLNEIFDTWEKDCKSATKLPKACLTGDPKKAPKATPGYSFNEKTSPPKPSVGRFKPKKVPLSTTTNDFEKPFEMTKKIDKKYDGLIERIMERRYREMGTIRHFPASASGPDMKSYQESLEKLRIEGGFNDSMKRNTMPRINKFNNNWLKRREINGYYEGDDLLQKNSQNIKPTRNANLNTLSEKDRYLGDIINKQATLNYKKPTERNGLVEEINLRRPQPLKPVEKPPNSSSFGDIHRNNKRESKPRRVKNGLETCKGTLNSKIRAKSNNSGKKGSKLKMNQKTILPPIECGLICTEITGRSKIDPRFPKIPPKRY